MTPHGKLWAIRKMMREPGAWDKENEALELAYSIENLRLRDMALVVIADRMCQPA